MGQYATPGSALKYLKCLKKGTGRIFGKHQPNISILQTSYLARPLKRGEKEEKKRRKRESKKMRKEEHGRVWAGIAGQEARGNRPRS